MKVLDHYESYVTTSGYAYIREAPEGSGILRLGNGDLVRMWETKTVSGHFEVYHPDRGYIRYYEVSSPKAVYIEVASPTVPVVSSVNVEIGSPITGTYKPDLASFSHSFSYTVGGKSVLLGSSVQLDQQTGVWTFTISTDTYDNGKPFLELAPNVCTVGGVLTLTTTQENGTLEGRKDVQMNFTVPASVVPECGMISVTRSPGDPTNGKVLEYLQNKTELEVRVSKSTAGTGSSIVSVRLTSDDDPSFLVSKNSGVAFGYGGHRPKGHGTIRFTAMATDARGRVGSRTLDVSVSAYAPPEIGLIRAPRCNDSGGEDENGNGLCVTVPVQATLQNGQLTLTITAWLRGNAPVTGYVELGKAQEGKATTFANCVSPDHTYVLRVAATDGLSAVSREIDIAAGKCVMDVLDGGWGIAFGKTATRRGVCDFGGLYKPVGDGIFETWTHTRTASGEHRFVGDGNCGRVQMTAGVFAGDSFTVNGKPVTAYSDGESLGVIPLLGFLFFVYDEGNARLNFQSGLRLQALAAERTLKPTLLMSCNWNEGALTIESSDKYNVFLVVMEDEQHGIAIKNPKFNNIFVFGVRASANNVTMSSYYMEYSGTVWTILKATRKTLRMLSSGSVSSINTPFIRDIYGLL